MTGSPRNPGSPGWAIPDGDVTDEEVNVLGLAGQEPPAQGVWLWVTAAEARQGGEFTALVLPRSRPQVSGGEVAAAPHPAPGCGRR
jgi:hypothetical protein